MAGVRALASSHRRGATPDLGTAAAIGWTTRAKPFAVPHAARQLAWICASQRKRSIQRLVPVAFASIGCRQRPKIFNTSTSALPTLQCRHTDPRKSHNGGEREPKDVQNPGIVPQATTRQCGEHPFQAWRFIATFIQLSVSFSVTHHHYVM